MLALNRRVKGGAAEAATSVFTGGASAQGEAGTRAVGSGCTEDAPFFSIVMPMYGSEAYIADAFFDVQNQVCQDWELIVVDDASPDGSRTIVERFAADDPRIRLETHAQNRGLSAARNTGLAAARGEYVWFPDPDDRYDFTLLQSVRSSLAQQEAPVAMFGHVDEFYVAGNFHNAIEYPLETHHYGRAKLRSHVLEFEKGTHYGYAWNKVYQRSYLQKGGFLFADDLPLIEDIEFNIRVFQELPALNVVGQPLYRYAKREQANLTNKFVSRYYEVHRMRIELLRNQLESWGLLDDEARATLGSLYARYILSALERNRQKESGMSAVQQREWLQDVFADSLFEELVPLAQADSRALSVCLKPLQQRNASKCLALGGLIHAAKNGALRNVFQKLKAGR